MVDLGEDAPPDLAGLRATILIPVSRRPGWCRELKPRQMKFGSKE
jgi:hypothetical protein